MDNTCEFRDENWYERKRKHLDQAIFEYNIAAEQCDELMIVAFTMTKEEREEFLNGLELGLEEALAEDEDKDN